jgi:hypothetical protein
MTKMNKELAKFLRKLTHLLRCRVTLLKSLTILEKEEYNPQIKELITRVLARVQAGSPFSRAFPEDEMVQSELIAAMMASSEEHARVPEGLDELIQALEQGLIQLGSSPSEGGNDFRRLPNAKWVGLAFFCLCLGICIYFTYGHS